MSELYELPNGWKWIEYKKVFDNPTSKPYQIQKSEYLDDGLLPIVDQGKEFIVGYTNSIEKKYSNDSNCIIFGDHTRQIKYIDFDFVIGADGTKILKEKDSNKYDLKYLYYQFISKSIKSLGYSRHFKLVKEMFFAIPPLPEQKRIVAKLDKLFEKIDKSIALHQKNMDEADKFMGSVLNDVFGELEEKYGLKKIELLFKIKSGDFLPKKNMVEDGGIDVYGGNGINGNHNEFNLSGENIIIGRVGALCGNVRCINGNIWLTDNAFYVSVYFEDMDKNYLTQMLIHIDLGSSANQAAQPVISYKGISQMEFPLPPLPIQQKVVKYLDEISKIIEKVKSVQKEKMDSLKALKASILDKAFRGEL